MVSGMPSSATRSSVSMLHAGRAGLVEQRRQVARRGLRTLGAGVAGVVAQQAQHVAQLDERLVGGLLDHRRRSLASPRR